MPQTPTGIIYPDSAGHTRLWDHFQALADSVHAAIHGDAWTDFAGAEIREAGGTGPAVGTSLSWAKFRQVGKTVWYQGQGSTTTLVSQAAVLLPNALTGPPSFRNLMCGQLRVFGTAPPSDQNGIALMDAALTRIIVHADTGGYRGLPAGHTLRWSVVYEVA
jgi:hypothetical protein